MSTTLPPPVITRVSSELTKSLPISERLQIAAEMWLDMYPGQLEVRYGLDQEGNQVLCHNYYGDYLVVYDKEELANSDFRQQLSDWRYGRTRSLKDEDTETEVLHTLGFRIKPMLASDPSVHLFSSKLTKGGWISMLKRHLADAVSRCGITTHEINFEADGLEWIKRDQFSDAGPSDKAWQAVLDYIKPTFDIGQYVSSSSSRKTLKVSMPEDDFQIMPQADVERVYLDARKALEDPNHPWVKSHPDDDHDLYAYMMYTYPVSPVRHGQTTLDRDAITRGDQRIYHLDSNSFVPGGALVKDYMEECAQASAGTRSQFFWGSPWPDVMVSHIYHTQVTAHQKERAALMATQPTAEPVAGALMPKEVSALKVGDFVGAVNKDESLDTEHAMVLWCKVTEKTNDTLKLFVLNGHWDFQLDIAQNIAKPHDIASHIGGNVKVVYTADNPYKDPALYNQAIEYMQNHARTQAVVLTPHAAR